MIKKIIASIVFSLFLFQPLLISDYSGPYLVDYVYDGDTISIVIDGKSTKVRFIGVDAPELNTEEGEQVKTYVSELLLGKSVFIELDKEEEDKYHRLLAYVYIDDRMVQEILLEKKMASVMTIAPNNKYESHFIEIEGK